eukprot:1145904-Pelagomonas_calceolata.AAC.2
MTAHPGLQHTEAWQSESCEVGQSCSSLEHEFLADQHILPGIMHLPIPNSVLKCRPAPCSCTLQQKAVATLPQGKPLTWVKASLGELFAIGGVERDFLVVGTNEGVLLRVKGQVACGMPRQTV